MLNSIFDYTLNIRNKELITWQELEYQADKLLEI